MKKGLWIEFVPLEVEGRRITAVWKVVALRGGVWLGVVKWYAQWRKYAFFPHSNTLYEEDCLRDIANFCEQQTRLHRSGNTPRAETGELLKV